jgi:hypothetical protein
MVIVLTKFPETVHRELEDITPDTSGSPGRARVGEC